jgi:arabinofuranosyltransferase
MKLVNIAYHTEYNWFIVTMLLGGIALAYGWHVFWFLTDDAYIAFRYVSNAHLGYGYVWNGPPFLPVEGYTSFLWIALLDWVWQVFGIEPPVSANWISLLFSYGVLVLSAMMVMQIRWHNRLKPYRLVFVFLTVVFLTANRTFLAWSSSGLETAMMNFFLILWIYVILFTSSSLIRAGIGAISAVFLVLTRPDGLLFLVATVLIVILLVFAELDKKQRRNILIYGFLPFVIVLIHQVWRLSFYGEWLPNTYYAKVTDVWPKSGFLYLLSFLIEYGLWFAFSMICWAVIKAMSGMIQQYPKHSMPKPRFSLLTNIVLNRGVPMVVIVTILFHISYYTYVVGGDHFEYRVYAYLLPVIFVVLNWSLNRLYIHPFHAISITVIFILLSMPVQWTHWLLTKDLNTRKETHIMYAPIAPTWPWAVRWYATAFDKLQSWLIVHHVGMRHQEHKVFWQEQMSKHISRNEGLQMSQEKYLIYATGSVGVPSWVMPHVYIIDEFGLNDYIVARTPIIDDIERLMAHSRRPPKGYIESFRPNVKVSKRKGLIIKERTEPVTIAYIAENERYWREKLRNTEPLPLEKDRTVVKMAAPFGRGRKFVWPVLTSDGTGLYNQIYDNVFALKNLNVNITKCWKCKFRLLIGGVDFFPIGVKDESYKGYTFITPKYAIWYTEGIAILFKKKTIMNWDGASSLKGKRIVSVRRTGHLRELDMYKEELSSEIEQAHESPTHEGALQMVMTDRMDVYISSIEFMKGAIQVQQEAFNDEEYHIEFLGKPKKFYPLFQQTERGKQLADIFDKGMQQLYQSGQLHIWYEESLYATLENIDPTLMEQ